MTPRTKHSMFSAALAASLGLACGSALAVQQGDILVRAGVAGVLPSGESDEITGIAAGAKVEADDGISLGINFTYMATDNVGVELLAAWPFSHDIKPTGTLPGLGVTSTVAETDQLPPTVTLQWHFAPSSNIRPYVGAGLNYTTFFNTSTSGALTNVGLNLDSSWGLAGEAGVDIDINNDWFVSGQVWYMDIDTEATIGNGIGKYDVAIDPWVYMVGIGTHF